MLDIIEHLPDGLLETEANDLHRILPRPSLIHLPGRRQPALFVSILLHGNEDSGWEAMRQVLAADLETQLNQVNVKATTTEKLGFEGRKEGIAVQAVVLIEK